MKASQRRAIERAAAYVRCPSCNRAGMSPAGHLALACSNCGWYGDAVWEFGEAIRRDHFMTTARLVRFETT